ncbi:MAG: VPLPA-CTERM sorting domain-containing protein [Mangrovicoccus sp.]|nr:VPLPA-CTERM sorting domain-containing protein [Mangrovicoccus sp.]
MIKSILFGAATALALAALPASAATVVVVDDFSTYQAPITTDKSTFPGGVSSTASGAGILGGTRQMTVISKQKGGGFTTSAAVSGNMSVFSNSPIGYGEVKLGYGTVSPLASFDLTGGGANAFVLRVLSSDLGVDLAITATDSQNRSSVLNSVIGANVYNQNQKVSFAGFSGTADLTDVSALQFRFVDSDGNSDFVLDKIATADVPLPAGGVLLVSALGAIGIRRARRKA